MNISKIRGGDVVPQVRYMYLIKLPDTTSTLNTLQYELQLSRRCAVLVPTSCVAAPYVKTCTQALLIVRL